ncbi:RNA polymerase sigma factor [Sphingobacterium sp. Mn56C]|uniref:RNA polymerase sigma factor n=1 Tax=Sphingobacterium sp. Mn56C TaxID=3395261 RepID=UPI003BEA88AA
MNKEVKVSMELRSEQQLWRNFVLGDEKAFEMLYTKFHDALYNYACGITQDVELAAESVQDLFIKLWRNHQNLAQPASPKHYLFRAIRNIIYNKQQQHRRILYVGDRQHLDELSPATYTEDVQFFNALPLSVSMQTNMEKLTSKQREALYLYFVEDFSYRELALHFNIKVEGAYKLVYRALEALKQVFNT